MKPFRIAVVIVTFDSGQILRKHLSLLRGQERVPDAVIIVNNGKNDIRWASKECAGSFKTEMLSFDNIGPAGGFREGAKKAYKDGHDLIIYADDDAFPIDPKIIGYFEEDAKRGHRAVVGDYECGVRIGLANHYLMVEREVLADAGFHFAPFFMMWEDHEYERRICKGHSIHHDPRIIISHPFTISKDSNRRYYDIRNGMVRSAIYGECSIFIEHFYSNLIESVSIDFLAGNVGFTKAFMKSVRDFIGFRLGRIDGDGRRMKLREMEANALSGREAILVSSGVWGMEPPFDSERLERMDAYSEIYQPVSGGADATMERIWPLRMARKIIATMRRFRGKDVIVTNQLKLGFAPFSTFARSVYAWDRKQGRLYHIYDNNPASSIGLMIAIAPLCLALFPFAIGSFFIMKGRYMRAFASELGEDRRFCQEPPGGRKKSDMP
jgi:GT2 family glycosyltransferase